MMKQALQLDTQMNLESRKDVLLRAAYDLLRRSMQGPYVKDAMSILVHYDGVNCDGYCLMEDIADELGLESTGIYCCADPIPLSEEDE